MSDDEIERILIALIEDNLPAKKRKAALEWLKIRSRYFQELQKQMPRGWKG
jgi:hypothetical protein